MMMKKNWNFKTLSVVFLTLVIAGFAISAPFIYSAYRAQVETTVVIDAGHGGVDGGVVGAKTGVKESELNLKIAKIVGEYLSSAGIRVVYTRVNSHGLYSAGVGNFKRDDMKKRAAIINKSKASAVVSIHMNAYTSPSRRGAQVFYSKKSVDGARFGDVMQDVLNRDINSAGKREYSALTAEKYILECTQTPVIIVECGFLSNPFDEANLINPEYQLKIGGVIGEGIIIFLSEEGRHSA